VTTDLSTTIHTYLTTAPTSEFHGQDVRLADHWQGSENLLWRVQARGQDAVLKFYLDAGQVRSRRQFDGQQSFAPLGLAPRPRWYDRYPVGLSRQVLLYDWAPGDPIDLADADQLLAHAAGAARVHSSDVAEVMRFSPNPINLEYLWRILRTSIEQIDRWLASHKATTLQREFGRTAGAAVALINRALPLWEGAPPAPVHGDLKPDNSIYGRAGVVLLDWERFGLGDPAQEAAAFLHASRQALTGDLQAQWLERYLLLADQPGLDARVQAYRRVLPFRDLSLLLGGLAEAERAGERMTREQRAFLLTTTLAAWAEAGNSLAAPPDDLAPELEHLTHQLTDESAPMN
jgi:Ser/Thr protein kinase RdoA (MazF antagonist)